jgi:hypothetical protein
LKKVLLGIVALAAAVLGYGWWQAHTHAEISLGVKDVAGKTERQIWADVREAQLVIRDVQGRTLSEARVAPPHGEATWSGVPGAINCRSGGQTDWHVCWRARARWLAQWASHATSARVTVGRCIVDAVPIDNKVYGDWWWWWVPSPHVGGQPVSYHQFTLVIDSARCAPATAP